MTLPSLPISGPLRVLVISASLSILAMLVAVGVEATARRWRACGWAFGTVLAALMALIAARFSAGIHQPMALLVLLALVVNAARFKERSGPIQIFAAITWGVALVCAEILF